MPAILTGKLAGPMARSNGAAITSIEGAKFQSLMTAMLDTLIGKLAGQMARRNGAASMNTEVAICIELQCACMT